MTRTKRSERSHGRSRESGEDTGERIRVLWLIKGLGRGGAEMLLYHAALLRDREAFDCHVGYLLGSRSWLVDDLRAAGIPVHLFSSESAVPASWAFALRGFLLRNRFDIVHVHSPYVAGIARMVARSLPSEMRPKTVSTEHLPWSGHKLPTRLLNAATFSLDRAHLAVSDAVVASIPPYLRRGVNVLVHGVPLEWIRRHRSLRATVRAELGVGDDEVLIGCVANMTGKKGYPDLIAAARLIVDRGRRVHFAVAGRGPREAEVRAAAAAARLGSRFEFLGPLEDATRFMAGCDVFVLASHHEGLPLVIMEALALGIPVVATLTGGIPQLVRDGVDGLLVPVARPERLADALDELIIDPERRGRMSRAAAKGAARFDNLQAIRTIESMYRELAAPKGQGNGGVRRKGVIVS